MAVANRHLHLTPCPTSWGENCLIGEHNVPRYAGLIAIRASATDEVHAQAFVGAALPWPLRRTGGY